MKCYLIVSKEISEAFNLTNKVPIIMNDLKVYIASDSVEMFYNIYINKVENVLLSMDMVNSLGHKTIVKLKKQYNLKFIPYNIKYDIKNEKNGITQKFINNIILKLLGDCKNEIFCEHAL